MDSPPVFASICAPSSLSKRYWRGTGNPSDPSSDEGGDPREGEGGGEMPQGKGTADGFNVPSPVSLPSSPGARGGGGGGGGGGDGGGPGRAKRGE